MASVRRRPWFFLAGFLVPVLAAAVWVWRAPPVWEARNLVRIDPTRRVPHVVAGVLLDRARDVDVRTEMANIPVRAVLQPVAERLDLGFVVLDPRRVPRSELFERFSVDPDAPAAAYALDAAQSGGWVLRQTWPVERELGTVRPGERVEVPGARFVPRPGSNSVRFATVGSSRAAGLLREALSGSPPDPKAYLIELAYRSYDRELAPRVVDAVAESYIAYTRETRSAEARSRAAALRQQLATLSDEAYVAEAELGRFAAAEGVIAPRREVSTAVYRRVRLESEIEDTRAEAQALGALIARIEAGREADVAALAAFPTLLGNTAVSDLLRGLRLAEAERIQAVARLEPLHPDVVALDMRIAGLRTDLRILVESYHASLELQADAAEAQLALLHTALAKRPEIELGYERRVRQAGLVADMRFRLERELREAELEAEAADASVQLVSRAVPPREPVRPRPVRDLGLGVLAGLLVGFSLAWGRERTDCRVRGPADVEKLGLPVLARLPRALEERGLAATARPLLVAAVSRGALWFPAPGDVEMERFSSVRARVADADSRDWPSSILVTGVHPGAGTTLTAAGLARVLAKQGQATLLVDAHLGGGGLAESFGVPRAPGLAEVLIDSVPVDTAIRLVAPPSLWLLPSGAQQQPGANLLGTVSASRLLEELEQRYDALVVDSPAVLSDSDAMSLASHLGGVVLVARSGGTDVRDLDEARRRLEVADAQLLGVVLTGDRPA